MKTNCFRYQFLVRLANGTVGVYYIDAPCKSFAHKELEERFSSDITVVQTCIVGFYDNFGDYMEV